VSDIATQAIAKAFELTTLVARIKGALGTAEDGDALVEVARDAHTAEMAHANCERHRREAGETDETEQRERREEDLERAAKDEIDAAHEQIAALTTQKADLLKALKMARYYVADDPSVEAARSCAQIDVVIDNEEDEDMAKQDADGWDWISIRDRMQTLSDVLEVPPDSHEELASELESMARWIRAQGG